MLIAVAQSNRILAVFECEKVFRRYSTYKSSTKARARVTAKFYVEALATVRVWILAKALLILEGTDGCWCIVQCVAMMLALISAIVVTSALSGVERQES